MKTHDTGPILQRLTAKPGDHRIWKKLLRLCAEIGRATPRTKRTDPSMTTAADAAARKCVRQHRNALIRKHGSR